MLTVVWPKKRLMRHSNQKEKFQIDPIWTPFQSPIAMTNHLEGFSIQEVLNFPSKRHPESFHDGAKLFCNSAVPNIDLLSHPKFIDNA